MCSLQFFFTMDNQTENKLPLPELTMQERQWLIMMTMAGRRFTFAEILELYLRVNRNFITVALILDIANKTGHECSLERAHAIYDVRMRLIEAGRE